MQHIIRKTSINPQRPAEACYTSKSSGMAVIMGACSFRDMPAKDQGRPALAVLQDDASEVVVQAALK